MQVASSCYQVGDFQYVSNNEILFNTCRLDMMSRDNRHVSSWLIGESIRETYQEVSCEFRPKYIVTNI